MRAFITGIDGQDGFYLSRLLTEKGYEIFGLSRRSLEEPSPNIYQGDLTDAGLIQKILADVKPNEIYNLAAVSDLGAAIKNPELTMAVNYSAAGHLIEVAHHVIPASRIFMALSSQVFDLSNPPQNETTSFRTENPYAVAKLRLYQDYVLPYRDKGSFVCSGFLFNHESPRRETRFVTRKITSSLVKIKMGQLDCLEIGNLNAIRDWGFAGDFVEAMWLMLQQPRPDDFVIATGQPHTVREFIETAASCLGIKITWQGEVLNEVGVNSEGKVIVKINKDFYRPENAGYALGDISKANKILNWKPKVNFIQLVEMMVQADLGSELPNSQ